MADFDKAQIARDAKIVNGSPEGHRLIAYLLDFCHVLQDSFNPKLPEAATFFNEGQRSVGNEIISLIYNDFRRSIGDTAIKVADQMEGKD